MELKSPRPFYDDEKDVQFLKCLYEGSESLSPTSIAAFASLPWDTLINTPQFIGLPCLVYYEPPRKHSPRNLPTGKLWAILMTIRIDETLRPKSDGIVFVIGDQSASQIEKLWHLTYSQLFHWAITNVPEPLRFHSLAYALKAMCGPGSMYETKAPRSDGYIIFQGTKCWTVAEWDLTLEQLIKGGIEFIDSDDKLPSSLIPKKPKKTNKKRKRTGNKDRKQTAKQTARTDPGVPSLILSQK